VKTLVVYYSNSGSNKYLAGKIANSLKCDIESIKPRFNFFPALLLFSLVKASPGIKSLGRKLNDYDRIILCGPIWMGRFVSPLRNFVNKYGSSIKQLYFVTCCASTDAAKDDKFGHGLVFRTLKGMVGDKCIGCIAFPIGLVLPQDKQKDNDAALKTRLSISNFTGQIEMRFDNFIKGLGK